jgi:hypothetical protein
MNLRTLTLGIVLVVALAACNFGNNIRVDQGAGGGLDITLTLSEAEVNQLLANGLANNPDAQIEQANIDLQPGALVITGNIVGDDGTRSPGSLSLNVGLVNGQVSVVVTNVTFAGYNANSSEIARINEQIQAGLNARAQQDNSGSQVTAVNVTNDSLSITVNVRDNNQQ